MNQPSTPPPPLPPQQAADDDEDVDMNDPASNEYEMVKRRFERTNFRVEVPFGYAYISKKRVEPVVTSDAVCRSRGINIYYFQRDPHTRDWRKRPFIDRWLKDENIRKYECIEMNPAPTPSDIYNLWPGCVAARLPPVPDEDVDALAQPYLKHIHEVYANEHVPTTEFLLDVFAQMVQRPHIPPRVAVSIFGKEGAGKGILLTFFRMSVLGAGITFQTSKASHDLMSRFANGVHNKIMVQCDETASMHGDHEDLKNLITSETIQLER